MAWVLEQDARPLPVRAEREGGREQVDELGDDVVPVATRNACGGPTGEARSGRSYGASSSGQW
jgi:hypothetical protein